MSKNYDEVIEEIIQTGGKTKGQLDPTDQQENTNELPTENTSLHSGGESHTSDETTSSEPGEQSSDPATQELASITEQAKSGEGESDTDEPSASQDNSEGTGDQASEPGSDPSDEPGEGDNEPEIGDGDGEDVADSFDLDEGDDGVDPDTDADPSELDASGESASEEDSSEKDSDQSSQGGEDTGQENSSEDSDKDGDQKDTGSDSEKDGEQDSQDDQSVTNADGTANEPGETTVVEGSGVDTDNDTETQTTQAEDGPQIDEDVPEPEPENEDPVFDQDGTSAEQQAVEEQDNSEDATARATEIISEAKEISDRLGSLAQEIVSQHGTPSNDDDSEVDQSASQTLSQENLKPLHRSLRDALYGEATRVLGFAFENDGESVYRKATRKVLDDAKVQLSELLEYKPRTLMTLEAKLDSLAQHMEKGLSNSGAITVEGESVKYLIKNGSLHLSQFVHASQIQTVVRELRAWITSMLTQYFNNASEGKRSSVMPFKPSVLRENAVEHEAFADVKDITGKLISPLWPGDYAIVTVLTPGTDTYRITVVHNPTATKIAQSYTVSDLDSAELTNLVNELKILKDTYKSLLELVSALADSSDNFLQWLETANEDELELVDFAGLLPMAYSPTLSLTRYVGGVVWSLVTVLEHVVRSASDSNDPN